MLFLKKQITEDVQIVYGFRNPTDAHYSLVTTIQSKDDYSIVHGLISKGDLSLFDFIGLWEYYKSILKTTYLKFEVL